mmetsp:Transcript_9306/g.42375  ORF Transcript_9306/g.42375 Transcript_9306/m.42375 type:complete len:233 (-) Transcript_9306:2136-2834(-)
MGNHPAAPGDPSEQLNLAVDPREQLPVERVEVVHRTLHLLLRHQLKLTVLGSKHQNSTPRRFRLLGQRVPRAHDVIRTRIIREDARDDTGVLLVGLEPELVQGFERDVVEESDKVGLGSSVKIFSQSRVRTRLRLVRDSPRLLAERDGAYVQLLYVVDAADGEVGLGREREGVGKGVAVERTRVQHLPQVHVGVDELPVVAVNHRGSVGSGKDVRRAFAAKRAQGDGLGTEA